MYVGSCARRPCQNQNLEFGARRNLEVNGSRPHFHFPVHLHTISPAVLTGQSQQEQLRRLLLSRPSGPLISEQFPPPLLFDKVPEMANYLIDEVFQLLDGRRWWSCQRMRGRIDLACALPSHDSKRIIRHPVGGAQTVSLHMVRPPANPIRALPSLSDQFRLTEVASHPHVHSISEV